MGDLKGRRTVYLLNKYKTTYKLWNQCKKETQSILGLCTGTKLGSIDGLLVGWCVGVLVGRRIGLSVGA